MQKLQRRSYELCSESSRSLLQRAFQSKRKFDSGIHLYTTYDEELDDDYHIAIGEKAIELDKHLVYLALVSKGQGIRVIVFVVAACKKVKASAIAKQVSSKARSVVVTIALDRAGWSKDRIREALLLAEEVARSCEWTYRLEFNREQVDREVGEAKILSQTLTAAEKKFCDSSLSLSKLAPTYWPRSDLHAC